MVLRVTACIACLQIALTFAAQPVAAQVGGSQPGAGSPPAERGSGAPAWFPLPQNLQQHLDQILQHWQLTTSKVQRYRCKFERWEYEWAKVKTYSTGVIKYEAPDKGLFMVENSQSARPPAQSDGDPQWVDQPEEFREHWLCDGQSVFEYDYRSKQIKKRPLPAGMRGRAIAEGPLPFLFRANAQQINQRFWMRPLPPPANHQNEHWLEAIPKTQQDAASFRAIVIILDHADFLPKGMRLIHRNNAETTFVFNERETNWNVGAQLLFPWLREFQAKLPSRDWKVVDLPPAQQAARPVLQR